MPDEAVRAVTSERSRYQNYLLMVLVVLSSFGYIDAIAYGVLLQDIKIDLHLSDMQLGLLAGLTYAVFYSTLGIPIARWADQGNRVTVIALTTALCGAMMVLYATVGNSLQLFLVRVGIAVGEAGFNPAALSLISDHFTRAERPRAIGRYSLGGPLSLLVGYLASGWLNEVFGWRTTFALLGLPSLALAGLVWLTVKEPRRAKANKPATASNGHEEASPSLKEVARGLWNSATVCNLIAYQVISYFCTGVSQFQTTFLIRSYGLKTGELGTWFAAIYATTCLLGIYLGGEWASRRAASNERLQLRAAAVMYSCLGLSVSLVYLSTSVYMALAMVAIGGLVASIPVATLFATVQAIVPARTRATSTAIMYLLANLIGAGLGPLAAGALSDAFHPVFGHESLRYTLLSFCPAYLWGGWHLWRASQTVAHDLEAAQEHCDGASRGNEGQCGSISDRDALTTQRVLSAPIRSGDQAEGEPQVFK